MPSAKKLSGLVNYSVSIDGSVVSDTHPVFSANVTNEINRIPSAVVAFDDVGKYVCTPGSKIVIKAGYNDTLNEIFNGIIVKNNFKAKNGVSSLIVECRSTAYLLTLGTKNKVFKDKTASDIIKSLIQDAGLTADVESTSDKASQIVQYNVTDWDFILSKADMHGLVVNVQGTKVIVKTPKVESAKVKFELGNDIIDFESEYDARTQIKKSAIQAQNWDSKNQKTIKEKPDSSASGAFTDLKPDDMASKIKQKDYQLIHSGALTQAELTAWANGRYIKSFFAQIRGKLKHFGDEKVLTGDTIEIAGFNTTTNGKVYVSAVRHELSAGDWFTHVQFGLSPEWHTDKYSVNPIENSGMINIAQGLHLGKVVKRTEDPENNHQIQLKISSLGDDLPIYARMTFPDAGKNRGICFFPEVDDEVVVGFANNDFRFPIILGYLYSSKLTPPITPDDDNFIKGIYTKTKIKIVFDDENKILTMETPGGNKITLDDKNSSINVIDKNKNTVDMEKGGITVKSKKDIKVEATGNIEIKATGDLKLSGMNVTIKAQAQLKEEGAAGVEVKSSAITTIKGSLVQIN